MARFSLFLSILLVVGCGDDDGGSATFDAPLGNPDGAGGTVDGADTPDGATANPDGGTVVPADGGVGVIACGSAGPCVDGQECCVRTMGGSSVEFTCIDEGDPCAGGRVSCDGPEDCESGQKCCGSVGGGLHAECVAGDAVCDGAELCHDSPDCTGEGAMCCALPLGSAAFCSAETCPAF